jgi:hypothetical protein
MSQSDTVLQVAASPRSSGLRRAAAFEDFSYRDISVHALEQQDLGNGEPVLFWERRKHSSKPRQPLTDGVAIGFRKGAGDCRLKQQ